MLVAETATLGAFLAQDLLLFVLFFDLMLVPFYFLFGAWGHDRSGEGGPTAAAATLKMIVYTLIGSLLMLVAAIATAMLAADGGHLTFSIAELAAAAARRRQPALDLLVLRRRLPGQDARLPPARLDARRLPGRTAAGPGRLLRRPRQGRRLRLPAGRAAALPRRGGRIPGGDPGHRPGLDPLRLGDGLHPDQRAADRRLLLGRPARLHHRRDLRPARRRRRRGGPADGQPRPRRRAALRHRRPPGRAHRAPRTSARWAGWRCGRRCWRRSS